MKNYIKVFYLFESDLYLEQRVNDWLLEIHQKGWRVFGCKLNDDLLIYTYTDEKHPHKES